MEEVQIQTELLKAGVLTVDEVRADAGVWRSWAAEAAGGDGGGGVKVTFDNLDGAGAVDYRR